MSPVEIKPYGTWQSPIQSREIASGTLRLSQTYLDGSTAYWLEGRPTEGGRQALVSRSPDGKIKDVLDAPISVRTLAQEYGGGAYVVHDGICYFSNAEDQKIYRVKAGGKPEPITADGRFCYADADVDSKRNRLIAVMEDHSEADKEAATKLVSVSLSEDKSKFGRVDVLVEGADFYSNPRVSYDGKQIAWLSWNHPNMPWDGCDLWLGQLDEQGSIISKVHLAGCADESIMQPEFAKNGDLYFISDRSGWWNLYVFQTPLKGLSATAVYPLDFDFSSPQWVFGLSSYSIIAPNLLLCTYVENSVWQLALLEIDAKTHKGTLKKIESAYTDFSYINSADGRAIMCAGSPTEQIAIVELNLNTLEFSVVKPSASTKLDADYVSVAQAIEFPSERNLTAHAFYYPPKNKDVVAPQGSLPPLVVKSHGGPTAATSSVLSPSIQYWTSRGYAVVDVNYGGSSNYGRQYRQRLNLNWGLVDLEDCQNAAKYLADKGLADPKRMVITGGSAGGYTTLCALTFGDVFAAGASHYGVSDLIALTKDTHKFESRYLDRLVGPLPDFAPVYKQRSPIHFPEKLSCPTIFFQGLEDKVVPPNQAEVMVEALKKKGLPVCYITYEGEQHGFRKSANISRTLDAEFLFYAKIFGFKPADQLDEIEILNFKK
ncbi:MAG: prolyl oligopeptidase family serine peptidase [Candidatus Obscuribacterales bacterium]|nr:prolyl oligopeptidase family serine peptidase [Candidatus Obscuribacterales bacterium]